MKFLLFRAATRLCHDNCGHQHTYIALPHRKSTTSNATPCCWHISLTGLNTSCMSSFLSSLVSVKVELKKMRTVFCTSLGSMTSGRTLEGPRSYNRKKQIEEALKFYSVQCNRRVSTYQICFRRRSPFVSINLFWLCRKVKDFFKLKTDSLENIYLYIEFHINSVGQFRVLSVGLEPACDRGS